MTEAYTVATALAQIEKCDFECEGGPLSNNTGWRWLTKHLQKGPKFALGEWVWHDISTAPKDGTEVLLWSSAGERSAAGATVGHWATDEERRNYIGDCGGECRCLEYDYDEDLTWLSWDGGFTKDHPPTHWMPLPDAPDRPDADTTDRQPGPRDEQNPSASPKEVS